MIAITISQRKPSSGYRILLLALVKKQWTVLVLKLHIHKETMKTEKMHRNRRIVRWSTRECITSNGEGDRNTRSCESSRRRRVHWRLSLAALLLASSSRIKPTTSFSPIAGMFGFSTLSSFERRHITQQFVSPEKPVRESTANQKNVDAKNAMNENWDDRIQILAMERDWKQISIFCETEPEAMSQLSWSTVRKCFGYAFLPQSSQQESHQDAETQQVLMHLTSWVRSKSKDVATQSAIPLNADTIDNISWWIFSACRKRDETWFSIATELLESLPSSIRDQLAVQVYHVVLERFLETRSCKEALRVLKSISKPSSTAYRIVIECCLQANQVDRAYALLLETLRPNANKSDAITTPTYYTFEMVVNALCGNSQYHGRSHRRQRPPNQWRKALALVQEMQKLKLRNTLTICNPILISMCRSGQVSEAKSFLYTMTTKWKIRPNILSYNTLMNAMMNAGLWQDTLHQMDTVIRSFYTKPDIYTYTLAMRACSKGGKATKALAFFQSAKDKGLELDTLAYTAVIDACSREGMWEKALALLQEMKSVGVPPSEITYSSVMGACGNGGQWQMALDVMQQMKDASITPSLITYNNILTSLSRASRKQSESPQAHTTDETKLAVEEETNTIWTRAQEILNEMQEANITKDGFTYSAALGCCNAAGDVERAIELVKEMRNSPKSARPTRMAYTTAILNCHEINQCLFFFDAWKQDYPNDSVGAYTGLFAVLREMNQAEIVVKYWQELYDTFQERLRPNQRGNRGPVRLKIPPETLQYALEGASESHQKQIRAQAQEMGIESP